MDLERGSGVLLHVSSLPGKYGIGTLGGGAFAFIDFLADAGQKYWQFLPLGPTSSVFFNSPYMSFSAFAGNHLFVDPRGLASWNLLTDDELVPSPGYSDYLVDYDQVTRSHEKLLAQAFLAFRGQKHLNTQYETFRHESNWLDDYSLFMALKEKFQHQPWYSWPDKIARRDPETLEEMHKELAVKIEYHRFVQFCFHSQWRTVKDYANRMGVLLIGDMPIYVAHDSADVWANQECFLLDRGSQKLTHVAGVPPDYFSETGQRWGNPLYRWKDETGGPNQPLYQWWKDRFQEILKHSDICRIDHFRGFESYWQIKASEETAVNGRWVTGPGRSFFESMGESLDDLPIIAEDLGIITPAVTRLRESLGFPGMKILQFAFDGDVKNLYLPHNYPDSNCIVYTGTHDNDTTLGWFLSDKLSDSVREKILRYANSRGENICRDMIRIALSSSAVVSILPMQDLLGFGSDCRMNTPGTTDGNWAWRCAPENLTADVADWLKRETGFYNRL